MAQKDMSEQYIYVTCDGDKYYYLNQEMRILHREDGPAVELVNGTKKWYINGKLHRENGPALMFSNGTKEWYCHGKLHRSIGPAVEYANGRTEFWRNGARIYTSGMQCLQCITPTDKDLREASFKEPIVYFKGKVYKLKDYLIEHFQ